MVVNVIADRDYAAEGGPATVDAFEWTEIRYDTSVALERAKQLDDGGIALTCVWSASRPTALGRFSMKATAWERTVRLANTVG